MIDHFPYTASEGIDDVELIITVKAGIVCQ